MVNLRDYQDEAIRAIRSDWHAVDRTLVVMATGCGKTIVFLALLEDMRREQRLDRALIIAHRQELITQPIERAGELFPKLAPLMGVVMAEQDDYAAPVVVATVQSLNAAGRLERVLSAGAFSHVIVDEAHHATADTYRAVLDRLPGAKVAGFTATPLRSDGDGLGQVFQRVAYRLPINAAIKRGALVPFDAFGFELPPSVDLRGLRQTETGWEAEALGDLLSAANVLEVVHAKWSEYAGDRQTIAFTASVKQAEETADYFRHYGGVRAAWVSGETPRAEREEISRAFRAGEIQFVANCMIYTEGFDAPETAAVLMVAPTKSDLVYTQRLGRALRTAPGKRNALVLDFLPVDARNVVMAGDVLGTPRAVKRAQAQAAEAGVMVGLSVDQFGAAATVDPSRVVVRVLNLLRKHHLAWSMQDTYASAALSKHAMLTLALPDAARIERGEAMRRRGTWDAASAALLTHLGSYRLYLVEQYESGPWTAQLAGRFDTAEEAMALADEIAEERLDATLAVRGRDWRREAPTDKQTAFLRRLRVTPPDDCTRGQAAQLITQALARQATLRAETAEEQLALTTTELRYPQYTTAAGEPVAGWEVM